MNLRPNWYTSVDTRELLSPSVLVYEKGVDANIEETIRIANGTNNLRPHIKTHKSAGIVRKLIKSGISKFKCATIAEAEVLGMEDAEDVLIAYPVTTNTLQRINKLISLYPKTRFSFLVDNRNQIIEVAKEGVDSGRIYEVYLDIDNGMNRTGVLPDQSAFDLYQMVSELSGISIIGLHVYDGHIHDHDYDVRRDHCQKSFGPVIELIKSLNDKDFLPKIIAGGTPTFPVHNAYSDREYSPGTFVFWDIGYATSFPDLEYTISAVLITRVISKPGKERLCLDLGYKSVASEMNHPRVEIIGLEDAKVINHSEEHLVLQSKHADQYQLGDVLFALPIHICPTIARYDEFYMLREDGQIDQWPVSARTRKISV